MERKSLYDISWQVEESIYREDPALSYSTLAKYEREGFNNLSTLFDRVESPSLTYGSAVDSIITGGQEEFDSRFFVVDFPDTPDNIIKIVKDLFSAFKETYNDILAIPDSVVINCASKFNYQNNWKPETRAKVIKEKGQDYYKLLFAAGDKTILSSKEYEDVINAVNALKTSEATKYYFEDNNPFDDSVEKLYQLKFKATLNDIDYRCMMDLCIVNYKDKTIQPIDLKTSHKFEWDFYKSFVEWNYSIQNRLYFRILEHVVSQDDYFKDFKILDYKDIVVCKNSLHPLVWSCPFTKEYGTLTFGKNRQIEMRDPEEIGRELTYYLKESPKVPIDILDDNNLTYWLNKL